MNPLPLLKENKFTLLAMDLIKSLDNYDDPEAEELWLQEAERRYQEYRQGKLRGRPADDVYRDAFSKVQK